MSSSQLLVPDRTSDIPVLAVAICRNRIRDRLISHAAIFFRDAEGNLTCLELGGPRRLCCGPVEFRYGWVAPLYDALVLQQLADLCEHIWEVYRDRQDLPYTLEFTYELFFDADTAELRKHDKFLGLTCATFVLAVFNTLGIKLLDIDSGWEYRPEDEDWQEWAADLRACLQIA